jgi:hypothetical protein
MGTPVPSTASKPATPARADGTQAPTYAAAAAAATAPAISTGPKKPLFARHPKAEKPARLLARLPTNYLARKASPIAILQKLRAELAEPLATNIKTVQYIPTGMAITAHSIQGMETLLSNKAKISAILTGARIKKEERWVTCIVPDLPPEYPAYEGGTQVLTAEQAAEEFEFSTKAKPLQSRWARA